MFLLLLALVPAAPAPFPRLDRLAALVGTYKMTWNGGHQGTYRVTFRRDGTYRCCVITGGADWTGTWRLEGNRLRVVERGTWLGSQGSISWTVILKPDGLRGMAVGTGNRFELKRLER